jgi:hypothetical protein
VAASKEELGRSGESSASVRRYGAALNICRREDLYKMSLGVLMMLPRDSFQSWTAMLGALIEVGRERFS